MAPQTHSTSSDSAALAPDTLDVKRQQVIVVVGNGMVGHRFLERVKKYDTEGRYALVSIGEEPIEHYNRMLLTEYFEHLSIDKLMLATSRAWYDENAIALKISSRATSIDVASKTLVCQTQTPRDSDASSNEFTVAYDHLVIATGASALVPKLPGTSLTGVFVYRTLQDLNNIIAYSEAQRAREDAGGFKKYALVIGGGLLGLEAAKAIHDLKIGVRIVNRGGRLMSRQLDDAGARVLHNEIVSKFGIEVLYGKSTKVIRGDAAICGVDFTDGSAYDDVFMVVFATGIAPRDELARVSELDVATRGGGIRVNDYLETSAADVYAIGECVSHRDVTYGLVAPGYEMADSLAKNFAAASAHTEGSAVERVAFTGSDSSTKLKLMGMEVAAFGAYFPEDISEPFEELVYNNPLERMYKKLLFSANGKKLLGGILVGDASDFPRLTLMCKMKDTKPLKEAPNEILLGKRGSGGAGSGGNALLELPDEAQVCSCNNVTKGEMCATIREKKLTTLADVKKVCNVGTGCGGCMPMVKDLFECELAAAGAVVDKSLCEHFAYSRQELYQIILVEKYETFTQVLRQHGRKSNDPRQHGCEICKPTIASIFASLTNHHVLLGDRAALQDTNDRFLANIQKSGQFSIVPRVAGGEITPEKLVVLGKVAKKYKLYSKITGGQRIDLFGAEKYDLPAIWEELVAAGFESGHAYGKSLRTVKSCVGSTWCRFGQQDSVGFAIFLENRYKGVRSPHKIKGGVSGCTRECAEARGKDFGLIATEKGYNVYVCGNGGTTPKHAVLLAPDVPQDLCVKYLDRFLMYYIRTADRLQRTSKWLESLEGGIEQLRRVVMEDSLGIAATLEKQMAHLLDTYECEWKKVVETPELRAQFAQFRNTSATQQETVMVEERGQLIPVDKTAPQIKSGAASVTDTSASVALESPTAISDASRAFDASFEWIPFGSKDLFDENAGGAVLYGGTQLGVFNITELFNGIERVSWFATQNMCPHDHAFVLAQGILGDADGRPKIVCPMDKKSYDLEDGSCMGSDNESMRLETFRVKVDDDGQLFILLPPVEELDARLGTSNFVRPAKSLDGSDANPSTRATSTASSLSSSPSLSPSSSFSVSPGAFSSSIRGCGDIRLDW